MHARSRRDRRELQQRHALFDIECGAHAGQVKSSSTERNRDGRRPHSDDDGLRIEHARHRGEVADHPADERVDHVERRDVDQHAARMVLDDPRGSVVLHATASWSCMSTWMVTSRNRPSGEIGMRSIARPAPDAFHSPSSASRCAERDDERVGEFAFVVTCDRSTPRWTMVWHLRGGLPLMMQSGPIRRAAATVFISAARRQRVDGGTPVMSMIAIEAPVARSSRARLSITPGAPAVQRADQRQRQDVVPELDHRSRQLDQPVLLLLDDLFAGLLGTPSVVKRASLSISSCVPQPFAQHCASLTSRRSRAKIGCFSDR
jgi:hypothetical protein